MCQRKPGQCSGSSWRAHACRVKVSSAPRQQVNEKPVLHRNFVFRTGHLGDCNLCVAQVPHGVFTPHALHFNVEIHLRRYPLSKCSMKQFCGRTSQHPAVAQSTMSAQGLASHISHFKNSNCQHAAKHVLFRQRNSFSIRTSRMCSMQASLKQRAQALTHCGGALAISNTCTRTPDAGWPSSRCSPTTQSHSIKRFSRCQSTWHRSSTVPSIVMFGCARAFVSPRECPTASFPDGHLERVPHVLCQRQWYLGRPSTRVHGSAHGPFEVDRGVCEAEVSLTS